MFFLFNFFFFKFIYEVYGIFFTFEVTNKLEHDVDRVFSLLHHLHMVYRVKVFIISKENGFIFLNDDTHHFDGRNLFEYS